MPLAPGGRRAVISEPVPAVGSGGRVFPAESAGMITAAVAAAG